MLNMPRLDVKAVEERRRLMWERVVFHGFLLYFLILYFV